METLHIEILNPKAKTLLKNLADLNLIRINKEKSKSEFKQFVEKLRNHSYEHITEQDIIDEVEEVRKSKYEK